METERVKHLVISQLTYRIFSNKTRASVKIKAEEELYQRLKNIHLDYETFLKKEIFIMKERNYKEETSLLGTSPTIENLMELYFQRYKMREQENDGCLFSEAYFFSSLDGKTSFFEQISKTQLHQIILRLNQLETPLLERKYLQQAASILLKYEAEEALSLIDPTTNIVKNYQALRMIKKDWKCLKKTRNLLLEQKDAIIDYTKGPIKKVLIK